MPKKGASLLWPMVVVTLLIVSTCTTIVYAYFNTDTLASTTIKFNGGVALTIQAKDYDTSGSTGLSISNGEYGQWLRKIDNETTWGDNTNATSSLTMSGLRVSPRDSSEPVYVRTMVVITITYTSATAPSIPDIPFVQLHYQGMGNDIRSKYRQRNIQDRYSYYRIAYHTKCIY